MFSPFYREGKVSMAADREATAPGLGPGIQVPSDFSFSSAPVRAGPHPRLRSACVWRPSVLTDPLSGWLGPGLRGTTGRGLRRRDRGLAQQKLPGLRAWGARAQLLPVTAAASDVQLPLVTVSFSED